MWRASPAMQQGAPVGEPVVALAKEALVHFSRSTLVAGVAVLSLAACVLEADWSVLYDGPGGGSDYARAVQVRGDEVVVLGAVDTPSQTPGVGTQLGLLRYDREGTLAAAELFDLGERVFVFRGFFVQDTAYVVGSADDQQFLLALDLDTTTVRFDVRGAAQLRDLEAHDDRLHVTGDETAVYDLDGTLRWSVAHDEMFPWPYGDEPTQRRAGLQLAVDADGNTFVGGYEYAERAGEADRDFWLAKYDPAGELLWDRTWGGDGNDQVTAMASDGQGGVFVTGEWRGGNIVGAYHTRRYSADGEVLWTRQLQTGFAANPTGLAVDPRGGCAVTGIAARRSLGGQRLTVSYSATGQERWRKTEDGFEEYTLAAYSHRIVADNAGRFFVSGQHRTSLFETDGKLVVEADDGTNAANELALDVARRNLYVATEKASGDYDIQLTRFTLP